MQHKRLISFTVFSYVRLIFLGLLWTSCPAADAQPDQKDLQWFRDAKFGLFIHWGLYSKLAGSWDGKNYYGSGEWIMNQARIPAKDYAEVARSFNPVAFDADQWAQLAKDAGIRYLVITAKHHEGFSMYDSKISDFTIVKSTPYGKDPLRALAEATRKKGLRFGFYYSQFLDWHEPDGGGNDWDFKEDKKDYLKYYREKSIPQLKELLTQYGPLGLIWFDMPGGLTKDQTRKMIDSLHILQPHTLFSSRIGQGLGDYTDFGDSEVPPLPVREAWESIYTHNDSWGYVTHDMNFKTPSELIRLLTNVASKGGNLMLNVGPDGNGNIPPYSVSYLLETGRWLKKFGASIYGTTYGLIPAQPWGVTTSKPGKLFLHVMERPDDGRLLIPDVDITVNKVYQLDTKAPLSWQRSGHDISIKIPALEDNRNTVFVVEYSGRMKDFDLSQPLIVSRQYKKGVAEAGFARLSGGAMLNSIVYSHYFGDWKHAICIDSLRNAEDAATFTLRFTEPGDFKVILDYACPESSSRQEGIVEFDNRSFYFRTLHTSEYNPDEPLLFIQHPVAIIHVTTPGVYPLKIHPAHAGVNLFHLRSVWLEPGDRN